MFISLVLVVMTSIFSATSGDQQTLDLKLPGGFDRVTYDPSRINKQELMRVIELSPVVGNFNFMRVPEEIELCKSGDPRYKGCGTKNYFNAKNAKLNLTSISKRIQKLDPENYPPDLKPVVEYLRRLQSLSLWLEQQKLHFNETDELRFLEISNGSINPKASCGKIISHIRETTKRVDRIRIARHDWSNCVWNAITSELGPYPKESWETFLKNRGVTEHEINTEED